MDEFERRSSLIKKLHEEGTIKTPEKVKMLEKLLNVDPQIDLLQQISVNYADQVLMDRTKATTLTKKSLMTSMKSVSNEIMVNASFKFIKMSKNKRVYADLNIQPYVKNFIMLEILF